MPELHILFSNILTRHVELHVYMLSDFNLKRASSLQYPHISLLGTIVSTKL